MPTSLQFYRQSHLYRCRYCPSGDAPCCHGIFPKSLNRDTTPPGRKKSRLDRVMSSTSWGDGAQLYDADAAVDVAVDVVAKSSMTSPLKSSRESHFASPSPS